jgi:hypothetical protein
VRGSESLKTNPELWVTRSIPISSAAAPPPITESQLLAVRRFEDRRDDLWTTFNRVQENLTKGGLHGRSRSGRAMSTRAVTGIDQNVKLNRALWVLADAMRQLRT